MNQETMLSTRTEDNELATEAAGDVGNQGRHSGVLAKEMALVD